MIQKPQLIEDDVREFLHVIGAIGWETNAPTEAEELVEIMGRLCYRSFGIGLNKNVTKVREGNRQYIRNINDQKHGAVIEHANISFIFHNVSRVFTHELVRHRVGVAISQESMRYVRIDQILQYQSDVLKDLPPETRTYVEDIFTCCGEGIVHAIKRLENKLDIDNQPFDVKKKLTSLLRRIAPNGMLTTIGWTANFNALRHIIPLRTSVHAEEEIREVFDMVARRVGLEFPNMFADMRKNANGEWYITGKEGS